MNEKEKFEIEEAIRILQNERKRLLMQLKIMNDTLKWISKMYEIVINLE